MDFLALQRRSGILLLDGAMGTELDKRGLMSRGENNLAAPDVVLDVHRSYVAAGCHALTTNTLTMNRLYVETHEVSVDVMKVNRAGAALARQAAGDDIAVLGNMCSTGQLLEPYGTYTESQFRDTFREQARILAPYVDAFLIETMFDLREALSAVRACKEVSDIPVIVGMAFVTEANGGRTVMGDTAEACARQLTAVGADVVGANCGDIGPHEMVRIVQHMHAATPVPILAEPNAGSPKLINNRTVFDLSPEAFAEGVRDCIAAGATIVGGCCGTTADHIRAVAQMLKDG